jgi:enterochelin esterase-like enzyme
MRAFKKLVFAALSMFLLALHPMAAQTTLPTMPLGGPDNSTFDKPNRYPAGTSNHTSFYSTTAGKNVDMWVYTPPGYSTSQTYGVVFCYQGIGTDAGTIFYDWCVNAAIVCDNLIGEKKISKGVIIVAIDDQFAGDYSNVRDMTINDAIPYIDSHYSTYGDADHRGLYGYSWGGGYAFNVGCANLDYFHYLSPSAAAPNKASDVILFPSGGVKAKQVLKCLFISWGQYDYQSIIDANVACDNYCNTNAIPHYKWVAPEQGHTGGTWRPALWNFLQLADRVGISDNVLDDGTPKFKSAVVTNDRPKQVQVTLSKSILHLNSFTGFKLKIDNQLVTIDSVVLKDTNQLVLNVPTDILENNTILLSYSSGNVASIYNKSLIGFTDVLVENLFQGSTPKIVELKTTKEGDTLVVKFNKKMQLPSDISQLALKATFNGIISIPFKGIANFKNDSTSFALPLDKKVYADYKLLLSYTGTNISAADSSLLKPFSSFPVLNYSKGLPVKIKAGRIEYDGTSGVFECTKPMSASVARAAFTLKVNGKNASYKDFFVLKNMIRFTLPSSLHFGDTIKATYTPGTATATDLGQLDAFSDYSIINQIKEPVWLTIPAKIEAENYYSQMGTQTETTSDTDGGLDLGWIENGDWFEYAIKNNTAESSYDFTFRVASPNSNCKFDVYLDNTKVCQIAVPNTGGWQTWQSVVKNIAVSQGSHYLRIVVVSGGFNVNYYNISKVVSGIENVQDANITIYPNPVSKEVIIGSTDFKYNKVEMNDMLGKTVFSKSTAYEPELHVQVNLPNGTYFVRISDGKQFHLQKIMINTK